MEEEALSILKRLYPGMPPSFYRRVLARLPNVRPIGPGLYEVAGSVELGDTKPSYVVDVVAGRCTCQTSTWGRRRRPCTHLAAAALVHEYGPGTVRVGVAVVEGCSVAIPSGVEAICRSVRRRGCLGDVGTRCILIAGDAGQIEVVVDGERRVVRLVPDTVPVALLNLARKLK